MSLIIVVLSFINSMFASSIWKAEAVSGKAEAIDVLVYSKPIFTIKAGMDIPQSFLVDMPDSKSTLVIKGKDDVRVSFKGPAMFGLGQYKNMTADVIIVKGEANVVLSPKSPIFKVETSSVGLDLEGGSAAIVRSVEKGDNFESYICISTGSGFIKDVFGKSIQKAVEGQSFNLWKGRIIEKGTCGIVKVNIPKPVEKEKPVKIKQPEKPAPKVEKPKNEEDTFDIVEIQKELFGAEVTTDEELRKQLVKGEKKEATEKEDCKDCKDDMASVAFMLPEGFNLIAPSMYPDKTLPALFYQVNAEGTVTSKVFSTFKVIKKDDGKYFEYMLKEGSYGVSVVKGPVFKIELKKKQKQRINISSFINPGYRLEIEVPLTKELLTSFEDKTMPIFVYPGEYSFKVYKGEKFDLIKQTIKPGSILFVEKK